MVVLEREIVLGDLLEAKDQSSSRGLRPRAARNERGAGSLILGVFENSLKVGVGRGSLNGDGVSSVDQSLDNGGGEGSVLERLLLGTEKDGGVLRHDCDYN